MSRPRQVMAAPPLVAPRVSLVAAAGPNAATNAVDASGNPMGDRWLNGLTFAPESGSLAQGWYECPDEGGEPSATKDVEADIDNPESPVFQPWYAWAGDHCTTLQLASRNGNERAERLLTARESAQIAGELWHGTIATAAGFPTPWLGDANLTALNGVGSPVPLVYAFGELGEAMASASPGRGMIHVSPRALVLLASAFAVRREGDLWLDPLDNIVVADAGYDGSGDGVPGGGDVEWFYGTDVVAVWRGGTEVYGDPTTAQSAAYNDNTVTWLAEKPVVYTFSPVCQIGIVADLCTVCCTPSGGGGG